MDNEAKPKPRKGTVGGGRAIGQKNKVQNPAVKKSISELFKNMMGLDDEAVERTGRIDGKGYGFRLRWKEILDGKRTPDPAYTNAVKLSLSYAVGTPGKMQDTTKPRESLIFLGLKPWEIRGELDVVTDKMIAEKAAEDKLKVLDAAKRPAEPIDVTDKNDDSEAPVETLELVEPAPEDFNMGRGR